MATDIAKLGIRIESSDIKKAVKDLNRLEKQSGKTEKTTKGLSSSFKMVGGALAAIGFASAIKGTIGIAAAFEKLEASLLTVTGSTEKATQAMDGIKAFATSTPFQVQEITDSFIKLKALGIQPTEANLRSFGNTSSSMGKSLNQMIEAVADAATGEFERLKEFGIKSKSEGDRVKFTFKGVTTEIGKNSEEITKSLRELGENNFGDGMANQMKTLDGAFSNFGDTVDNAVSKLAKESGFNDLIKSATLGLSRFIRELTGTENADDLKDEIESVTEKINAFKEIIKTSEEDKKTSFFGGFFSDGAILNANQQIESLNVKLAELKSELKDAEGKKGGLDAAAALTPEEKRAKQEKDNEAALELQFEQDQALFGMQLRRIEMEEWERDEKLRVSNEKLAAESDYFTRLYKMQSGSYDASLKFATAIRDKDMRGALQTGALMLSNQAKQSKEGFELQKAFALANAVVTLPSAVMKSFDNGGGYPWGLIPAGLMLAQGLQQINSIKSSSFGGGGGAPAISGGGSTAISAPVASGLPDGSTALPDATEQKKTQQVSITLNGAGYSRENVRELIESINEEIGDGAELVTA